MKYVKLFNLAADVVRNRLGGLPYASASISLGYALV